jgi:hypothetical protein
MQALHLQMKPQCPQFYKTHMSVLDLRVRSFKTGSRDTFQQTLLLEANDSGQTLMERARTLPFGDRDDFGGGPPSSPIRLMVTDSPFMDLAVTGSWMATQPSTVATSHVQSTSAVTPRSLHCTLESSIGYSTGCLRFESRIDWTAVVRMHHQTTGLWPAASSVD